MKKKIVILCLTLVVFQNNVFSYEEEAIPWLINQTFGVHAMYSDKLSYALAYQGCVMFLSYGYSYHFDVGNKLYVGLTPSLLLAPIDFRVQYGRSFSEKSNLLKISAEYFLAPYTVDGTGLNSYSTIGIFVEKNFGENLPMNGYSFGVSLNWSIWDIFIIKDKNRKYFRKYEK